METKQKKAKMVMSVLALGGLLVFSLLAVAGDLEPSAPPAPTMKTLDEVEPRVPIHASDLPLTIAEPNSYYLVEDINFTDDANHAITIECNDVTIDLMGYTLKGMDSRNPSGIYMSGCSNIEIRNGTIRDFGESAIYSDNQTSNNNYRLFNIRALSSGHGIYLEGGQGHIVKDCTGSENDSDGISVGGGSTIAGNTCYNNGNYGIYTGSGCTVAGNTVSYNTSHGINANSFCTITNNTAYSNGDDGINGGLESTVTNNTSNSNNGRGIYVAGCSTITNNTVNYNEDTGIYASSCSMVSGNTLYTNNTSDTTDSGGIYVYTNCMVKNNTLMANKQNNIYAHSLRNSIEENLVTNSDGNGIYFRISGNFYANNRASGNVTDYNNGASQTDGGGNYSF